MQMRNRTPTAASPRIHQSMNGGYKDKKGGASRMNPMNYLVAAFLLLTCGVAVFASMNKASSTTASPTNSVRRAVVEADGGAAAAQQDVVRKEADLAAAARQEAVKAQMKEEARRAAQDHHDQDRINIQQADEKAMAQRGVKGVAAAKTTPNNNNNKKKEKLVVRDADGDIVTDDMLARDIAEGRDVEMKQVEEVETDVAEGENRWQHSKTIPEWLKTYFDWHVKVLATLEKKNWREQRYLVMTCLGGEICGNVAHRLRPVMAMLRLAADSKRIFYIHWDMPDRLEKFLHPPQHGGINWTVPDFVMWKVRKSPHVGEIRAIDQQAYQEDRRVVNVMYNDDAFAEPYYNERRKDGEKAASETLRDVWNVLFKPSIMLHERIGESLRLMGLTPGEYATAHIDYEFVPRDHSEQEELRLKVENAMNCMSQLRPGGPFLVAAQTYAIAREAIVYGKQHNVHVHAKQIAHDSSTVPTDLYTSFVEILLMAGSRCVAYNRGGYGQLGYILGFDYNCRLQYGAVKKGEECQWKDPPQATEEQDKLPEQEDPDK